VSGAPVHYGAHRGETAPWIAAGTGTQRIDGFLYTLAPTLGDARVRDAAGLTVYAGALHKVAWLPRRWTGTGRVLVIAGRKLDGSGSFRATFPRALAPWPNGANTKVLWLVDEPGGPLRISGTRLDGHGSFEQTERAAGSPSYAYPSIVVVPEGGCWPLALRTRGRGAVLVMRALAPP
jgi:hypothetical protein